MQMSSIGPRQWMIILATAFVSCLYQGHTFAAQTKGKPQPPLTITISPTVQTVAPENIKPGDIVEFIATVVSHADAEDLQISVVLPKGTELISGALSWSGPVGKNESRALSFIVKVPAQQQGQIKARVIMPSPDGHTFAATAHYPLGKTARSKAEAAGTLKKDRKGRDVIEYR